MTLCRVGVPNFEVRGRRRHMVGTAGSSGFVTPHPYTSRTRAGTLAKIRWSCYGALYIGLFVSTRPADIYAVFFWSRFALLLWPCQPPSSLVGLSLGRERCLSVIV